MSPTTAATYPMGGDPAALPAFAHPMATRELPRRAFVEPVMGLPISVHVRGPRAESAEVAAAVSTAFAGLREVDATFSTYRVDSEVSRIRRGEQRLTASSPLVCRVAALCDEAEQRTGGAFSARRPDPSGRRSFDPTGLVKGWAVEGAFERLTEQLAALGDHDTLICAGGDVVVGCARSDTPDWVVGIEDPRDRRNLVQTLALRRGSVATSGTAARGAHIVDPASGVPVTGLLSATVIGPELLWADVYATAAFVRGRDAITWIAGLADHAGLVVAADGTVTRT